MKKLLSIIAISAATIGAFAQGTVVFTTTGAAQRIFDVNGSVVGDTANTSTLGAGVNGTNFFVQLWAAPGQNAPEAALQPVNNFNNTIPNPLINIRNGANAGFVQASGTTSLGVLFNGGTLTTVASIPGISGGGGATYQIRAWWSAGNTVTSWAAALASNNPLMRAGKSSLFNLVGTGDPNGAPPTNPVSLSNFQGFQLVAIPEPSSFALAGMGLASLLIFRRRK